MFTPFLLPSTHIRQVPNEPQTWRRSCDLQEDHLGTRVAALQRPVLRQVLRLRGDLREMPRPDVKGGPTRRPVDGWNGSRADNWRAECGRAVKGGSGE